MDIFILSQDRIVCHNNDEVNNKELHEDDIDHTLYGYTHGSVDKARFRKHIAQDIKALIPRVFGDGDACEETVLYHHDLHTANILVDDTGHLTGILDWECTTVVPLWEACQLPAFLQEVFLRRSSATEDSSIEVHHSQVTAQTNRTCRVVEEDERKEQEGFWEHLTAKEQGELADVYLKTMVQVCPEWVNCYKDNKNSLKANLACAVGTIGNCAGFDAVVDWCRAIQKGNFEYNLRLRLRLGDRWIDAVEEPPTEDELLAADRLWKQRESSRDLSSLTQAAVVHSRPSKVE